MHRLLTALACLALTGCGDDPAPEPPTAAEEENAPFRPVASDGRERPEGRYLVATVTRRTALRSRPGGRVLARLGRRTEFGSDRVLGVVRRRDGWLGVTASELRNGRVGWVREDVVRLSGTDWSIRVDRSRRLLRLLRGDRVVRSFRVAVGRPGNETPLGRFAVTDRLRTGDPASPYGCCAVALSGHQPKLVPGWPGGDRLAIHGTPQEETVGRAASLGCLRASSQDIRALMRRVPLGAPVFVRG